MELKELSFDEQVAISGGSEAGQAAMYALGCAARFVYAIMPCYSGLPDLCRFFY